MSRKWAKWIDVTSSYRPCTSTRQSSSLFARQGPSCLLELTDCELSLFSRPHRFTPQDLSICMFEPLLQAVITYVCVGFAQCWSLSGPRAASTPSTGTFVMARHAQSQVVSSRVFCSALYWSWAGNHHIGAYPNDEWIPSMSDENDDERDGSADGSTSISLSSDWLEDELTLRSSPNHPNPDLLPHRVATTVVAEAYSGSTIPPWTQDCDAATDSSRQSAVRSLLDDSIPLLPRIHWSSSVNTLR
jgi:hypothetical protein